MRESDRLVGETVWSDRAANETHEFTLGQDPDLQYTEYVQLNSRRNAYEANGYRSVLSTYTISLTLLNNKDRPINIEYRFEILLGRSSDPERKYRRWCTSIGRFDARRNFRIGCQCRTTSEFHF